MDKVGQYLYSGYVWAVCFLWMSVICIATYGVLPVFPYRRTHSWIAAPGFAFVLRLIGCPTTVTYDARFDPKRRSVFCQNHVNLLDAFVASKAIPHVFCGLMHRWQFRIPIYGWMMAVSKGIPMEKKSQKLTRSYMSTEAAKRRSEGFSILAFPEGSRTPDGKVHRFKRGVFLMAREAGYPVVPVAVEGSFSINQRGSVLFRPGKIKVFVGPQMETSGLSDDEIEKLAKECEASVRKAKGELAA